MITLKTVGYVCVYVRARVFVCVYVCVCIYVRAAARNTPTTQKKNNYVHTSRGKKIPVASHRLKIACNFLVCSTVC